MGRTKKFVKNKKQLHLNTCKTFFKTSLIHKSQVSAIATCRITKSDQWMLDVKQPGISHIHYPTIACIIQCDDMNIEQ